MKCTVYSVQFTVRGKRGAMLILTFIIMATLTAIAVSFLFMTSIQAEAAGYDVASSKAIWLAEAGLQKAVWNLKTPVASGGQGEDWTTGGTSEDLGDGSYNMEVVRWDWALSSNSATASASSSAASHGPELANDGDDDTYWESASKPTPPLYEDVIINFPYTLTINKARFIVPAGSSQQRPKDYSWDVSTDGVSYTSVFSAVNNNDLDVTNEFTAAANVNYLKLHITKIAGAAVGVRIATVEAIGSKITSTGTVDVINRKIEETIAVDETTETAYDQIDWDEIAP